MSIDAALGVVDEHGLAEAELRGERLPLVPVGHHGALADDAELVAVAAVRPAEDAEYVVVSHRSIEASRPRHGRSRRSAARGVRCDLLTVSL